jgi:hypothetical protein
MGATITGYWPGITAADFEGMPGFFNDYHAYAAWVAERESQDEILDAIIALGCGSLLTVRTEGLSEGLVDWVEPSALESAALRLRDLVRGHDRRTDAIVASYEANANGIDDPADELCRDLEDIAAIARYAASRGATTMTLDVNW